jgi:molecular chaperone GrpE
VVSKKKSFTEKLNNLIWGEPIPGLSAHDRDTIHHLDDKLNELLALLKTAPSGPGPVNFQQDLPSPTATQPPDQNLDGDLAEQIRKLAKTQFKANTLQEKQLARQEETLAGLQKALERQEKQVAELAQQQQQAVNAAREELIKNLLPVLDSLDAAFESGRGQVLRQPMPADTRRAVIAWLDGVRLARMRLLDVLKVYHVTPIPTVGQAFDPHRHVAVAVDTSGKAPEGTILAEDRRGYATPDKVLRFAEVVVARSK